jgi:hypothetical protein
MDEGSKALVFGWTIANHNPHGNCFDISRESYGIDNFSIQAECAKSNRHEAEILADELAVSDSARPKYCLARDLPCEEGEGMVHLCHYTRKTGYQTFCVPEADSEVLQFYVHDYCGPCVGGFGGVNM